MKPRVGVYLSEGMAARLSEAAKNPRATKSALVEAALGRFLGSDDDIADTASRQAPDPRFTNRALKRRAWLRTRLNLLLPSERT
jgi:hypothetical protein